MQYVFQSITTLYEAEVDLSLDDYASKGWRIHSWHENRSGDGLFVIWEKE